MSKHHLLKFSLVRYNYLSGVAFGVKEFCDKFKKCSVCRTRHTFSVYVFWGWPHHGVEKCVCCHRSLLQWRHRTAQLLYNSTNTHVKHTHTLNELFRVDRERENSIRCYCPLFSSIVWETRNPADVWTTIYPDMMCTCELSSWCEHSTRQITTQTDS